jgi:hypothetical protein
MKPEFEFFPTGSRQDSDEYGPPRWKVNLQVRVSHPTASLKPAYNIGPRVDVFSRDLRFEQVRSVFHVLFHTRLATEYLLPFVVALLPLGNFF